MKDLKKNKKQIEETGKTSNSRTYHIATTSR